MKNLAFILLLFWASASNAQSEVTFAKANETYTKGQYAAAIEQYESIVQGGEFSMDLHYNLANAYFRTNQLGKAVLHYEKALKLSPGNADVLNNLAIAKDKTKDEIGKIPEFFLFKWWNGIANWLGSTTWAVLGLLLLWGGIGGLIYWQIGKERAQRKKGFAYGLLGVVLSILPLTLAFTKYHIENDQSKAIIIQKEVNFKSAPDDISPTIQLLHEGTKVIIKDEIGDYYQVNLVNGDEGWIGKKVVEVI